MFVKVLVVLFITSSLAQSTCNSPMMINSLPFVYNGDTRGGSAAGVCSDIVGNAPTHWFKYTPTNDLHEARISACTSSFATAIHIFRASSCSEISCTWIQSDVAGSCNFPNADGALLQNFYFQTGQPFLIAVTGVAGAAGTYTLEVIDSNSAVSPNDMCANAIPITTLPFSYSGDTLSATQDFRYTINQGEKQDVWFKFQTVESYVNVDISICEGNADFDLYLVRSCSSSYDYYDDAGCGVTNDAVWLPRLSGLTIIGGQTYYIVVSSYYNRGNYFSAGTYNLQVRGDFPTTIITCPPDLMRPAGTNCKYTGSTGQPSIHTNSPTGDSAITYTKSPKAPYNVGTTNILYTAFVNGRNAANCTQKFTAVAPSGVVC